MKLIKDLGPMYATEKSKQKRGHGIYECPDCLKHFRVITTNVNSGRSTKCKLCARKTIQGLSTNPLYRIWTQENYRCNNKKSENYKNYGARGIKVSEEFSDFRIWLIYVESLEDAYKDTYSIDRIDNDKGYERGNLRWASQSTQAQNTRIIRENNKSGYRGVHKKGKRWRVQININHKNIHLGTYDIKEEGALVYDNYIKDNNLEHTANFAKTAISSTAELILEEGER